MRLTRQADPAPITDLAAYEKPVARTLERGFRWMYFSPRLEQLFEYETQVARSRHLVGVGILWIAVGVLYSLFQPAVAPERLESVVRLFLVTPVLIAVTFSIWWGVRPFVRELLMMMVHILAPVSMILVVVLRQGGESGAERGALTIVLLFITVVVRLRFWYATTACLAIVAAQVIVPPLLLDTPVQGNVPLALVTLIATLTANYTLEREFRLNYLQRTYSRIQGAQLAATVEKLHDLSQRDPLTGLSNRRALDEDLEELRQKNEQFAVILVDIDVFKQFNDRYGHQVGDDCLRRVAAMLRASLRFTADRIARIGGEEFAIILPDTALEDARITAERMRTAVYNLRIPHVASSFDNVVTISVGVSASTGPTSPSEMITEADRALYRAKANGRNRVEVARPQDAPVAKIA